MNINKFTQGIYKDLLKQPKEINQRTGIGVYALPGVTFQTDLIEEGFPLLSIRKLPFHFIPEIMWFLSGTNNAAWLSKHTKIWDSFIDPDGTISSAYGYRWRQHFGLDQISAVLGKLKADPSSRHAVVMMWDPFQDLAVRQKNVPCPYTFTLNIIGSRLHLHLIIRSNDMYLGAPTDFAGFAFLQHIFAQHLNVQPGILTVSISNAHIYANQVEAVLEMLRRPSNYQKINLVLPKNALERAESLDETLIIDVKDMLWEYNPGELIKGVSVVI